MIDERLEFEIAQLADGTLSAERIGPLRAQIASNADAAALLESYKNINAGLASLPTVPTIDWDRFSTHIADHIDRNETAQPVSYPMPWLRRATAIAMAACVVIAASVTLRLHTIKINSSPTAAPRGLIAVAGPSIEAPAGDVIQQISIGPSAAVAGMEDNLQYGDAGVVAQSQRVVIASAADAAQDTPLDSTATPY